MSGGTRGLHHVTGHSRPGGGLTDSVVIPIAVHSVSMTDVDQLLARFRALTGNRERPAAVESVSERESARRKGERES